MAEEQKAKSQKVLWMLVLVFTMGALAGGGYWWYESVHYVTTDDARISGNIVAISPKIAGKVTEVLVKEGDAVKAGQIVAKLDLADISAQKAQAQAALAAARAQYADLAAGARPQEVGQDQAGVSQAQASVGQAQASYDNAAADYSRMKQLYTQGAISASKLDQSRSAYEVAQQNVEAAQAAVAKAGQKLDLTLAGPREQALAAAAAQVKQAEAALAALDVTQDHATVTAPCDGVISVKSVSPGEVVAAGQPLFSLTQLGDVWVNARIEETKIGKLKVGQRVDYTIDGYDSKTFTGTVYEIGSATNSVFSLIPTENSSGNFTKVTQRIPIKISLPSDRDVIFRPGMSAIIKIYVTP